MCIRDRATTDYWVNDQRGDPLFVVTADANAAMTKMLVPSLTAVSYTHLDVYKRQS